MIADVLEQFRPHQKELRQRVLRCVAALLITSTCAYFFRDQLTALFLRPLYLAYPPMDKLVYTKLTEAFLSYIKLAVLVGLIVALPYILYQIWLFVAPGLLEKEKKAVRVILGWATMLFVSGGLFAYFEALPRILHYFMSFAGPTLIPRIKLGMYLTFIARIVLTFGIAFEIPFLMVMATRVGLLQRGHFQKKRLYFYCAILVLSFLLTTGDITSTVLLGLPLLALYEAGIVACRLFGGKTEPPAPVAAP